MIFKILLLIILILINGLFSATEIAFLSINKYDLNKSVRKNNKKAIKIAHLINDSSSFLSAIQIAITLSGFLASAFAAESFASEISDFLNITSIPKYTLTNILIVIITLILSYFTLVFGELVPKKIGLAKSKEISFLMVDVINFVIKLCKPFIIILKSSTDFIVNLLNISSKEENIEDEIKNTIIDSSLEELEKQLLLNVFEFNDTKITDVMTKWDDVIYIDINDKLEDIIKKIKKYKFTRFPVINEEKIIGLLNIKDLIISSKTNFKLKNYVRKIITLDGNMIIDDAFLYLISHYEVMALVNINGENIGIVTIEDIIEDIIGDIEDEYNKTS